MKKVLTTAVVAVLALGLSACGGKSAADRCAEDPDVHLLAENMGFTPSEVCINLLKEDPEMFEQYWGSE